MMIFSSCLQGPLSYASSSDYLDKKDQDTGLLSQDSYFVYSDSLETIPVWDSPDENSSNIFEIPNTTLVKIIESPDLNGQDNENDDFLFVSFELDTESETKEFKGYIKKEFIINESELDSVLTELIDKAEGDNIATVESQSKDEIKEEQIEEQHIESTVNIVSRKATSNLQLNLKGYTINNSTHVYISNSIDSEILVTYPKGTILEYHTFSSSWYQIPVKVDGINQIGYIHKDHVINANSDPENIQGYTVNDPTRVYERASTNSKPLASYPKGSIINYKTFSTYWYEVTISVDGKEEIGYIHRNHVVNANSNPTMVEGYTVNNPTRIYERATTNSRALVTYPKGSVINYKKFSTYWYQVTVSVNGRSQTGYIHRNHVIDANPSPEKIQGYTANNPTKVYERASTNSRIIETYPKGSIISYKTFSTYWYQVTVSVNGRNQTGYIHRNHVVNANPNPKLKVGYTANNITRVFERASTNSNEIASFHKDTILSYTDFSTYWYEVTVHGDNGVRVGYIHRNHIKDTDFELQGMTLKNTTHVYENRSTNSRKLKSYEKGTLLLYNPYDDNWYQTVLVVNGKKQIGYINKLDVENSVSDPSTLRGYTINSPTRVYDRASTNSTSLKTYPKGSIISYSTFSSYWYQVTVTIDGIDRIGYIHKNHVTNANSNPIDLEGYTVNSPTRIYERASTGSRAIASYPKGTILKYKDFSKYWYEVTVSINGRNQTGYVHSNHVVNGNSSSEKINGYAINDPTRVYERASTNSSTISILPRGKDIIYELFSTHWYRIIVNVNGKSHIGYVHRNHVSETPPGPKLVYKNVSYNYSFKEMIDIQMTKTPKSDGAGKIAATRGEVEFFSNPNNFSRSDREFFQFLVLSRTAGFNANEINRGILSSAGTLTGQGQAFITAANRYNINEAYLIAHALHETGNGTSTLAQGIPVDKNGNVTRDSKGNIATTPDTKHTVYNMYGYSAVDSDPINGGAKYAFNHGWFTPEAAIIGGAKSINSYISRGQDTLYKMRWNPDSPGYPQYATHVQWATGQTRRIYDLYQLIYSYEAVFEIPSFRNIPNSGSVVASSLNVRTGPSTSNDIITSLANGSKVQIIGSNPQGWYQIKIGSITGWVSATYINLNY